MKKPIRRKQLPEYGLGGWLKKNLGPVLGAVGGLGAIALTGGLAAPAVAPAMGAATSAGTAAAGAGAALAGGAGLAGTTAATAGLAGATGSSLAGTLGAGALGSKIGSTIGGAIDQNTLNEEQRQAQDKAMAQQQFMKDTQKFAGNRSQSNIPTFCKGGRMKKKYPDGGVNTDPTKDPNYVYYQNKLKEKTPELQDRARLYYYTQQFNKPLRSKNPKVYDELVGKYGYNKDNPLTTKTRTEGADPYAKNNPNFYLSPEEQQKILGDNWNDYNQLRSKYGSMYNLLGEGDDKTKPETWKVGARHAVAFNPVTLDYSIEPTEKGQKSSSFLYNISYDPNSESKYSSSLDYKQYAKGGYTVDNRGFANSELEDQEVYRTPSGMMEQLNGPTHAEGGIPMNLPQGTEILGKNKVPGTNKSYKEFGDKLMKDYNKYTKTLNGKYTPLAKKTAEAMLEKTHQQFSNLMNMQEAEKGNHMMPDGSMMSNKDMKYDGGGEIPTDFKQIRAFQSQYGLNPDGIWGPKSQAAWNKYGEEYTRNQLSPINPIQASVTPNNISPRTIDIQQASTNQTNTLDQPRSFNGEAVMGQIMNYAPIAYNVAQGLFGKSQNLKASDYYNPQESQVTNLMSNRRYNVNPELEANRNAQINYIRALRQGAPSQAQYLGNIQNSQIARSRADAEAIARKQNMDNSYMGEEAQMRANLGQQRAQTNLNIQDMNDRNASAKKSFLSTGLSQLQQANQANQIMKGVRNRDKQLMDIYRNAYRGYSFVPQFNS